MEENHGSENEGRAQEDIYYLMDSQQISALRLPRLLPWLEFLPGSSETRMNKQRVWTDAKTDPRQHVSSPRDCRICEYKGQ